MGTLLFATCAQLPGLDPDDRHLVRALENLGFCVKAAIWNDRSVDWSDADACVIRSTWDYHLHHDTFLQWVDEVLIETHLLNPAHIIRWNAHKFYLRELENAGIPIVPTFWLECGTVIDLRHLLDRFGWPEAIVKPAYGASADGILHIASGREEVNLAEYYINELLLHQDALLQPFLSTISDRHERALVFIDGKYSHAVTKTPFMHARLDLSKRACLPPGASGELPVRATEEEVALATRALDVVPRGHVFARVDIVRNGSVPCVLEVELIEPTLYLYAKPTAAFILAHAIKDRIVAERSVSFKAS